MQNHELHGDYEWGSICHCLFKYKHWEHQIKLTVELSGTTYFEFQEAPKASESNLKFTEINRKLPY